MRVITSIQGSVALKFVPDEVGNEAGVLSRDVVAFVAQRYKFSLVPEVPPGLRADPRRRDSC
jgi:hypothetical protein